MKDHEIPAAAPDDALAATHAEVARVEAWVHAAFQGTANTAAAEKASQDLFPARVGPPFSFTYDGASSAGALPTWARTATTHQHADFTEHTVQWSDPKTGLRVVAEIKVFKHYAAAEWVLRFENTGSQDTPIIADIRALDLDLHAEPATPVTVHTLNGDSCNNRTFAAVDTALEPGQSHRMAPTGGRSASETAFPWFNLQYGDHGMITAVGWTGQWAAQFDRALDGSTRVVAGMELTHLKLHPGERIRSPRILVLPWQGDRQRAHIQFRRLLLFHYAPKLDGRPALMPVVLQTFDRYWSRPGWATEAGQKDAGALAHELGFDTLWLDAAWFPTGFPNGVGSWHCEPTQFPNGLKPVSDVCHKLGLKFVLWFEPERVAPGSEIAREHPEFVFGGDKGGLFKLNEPEARRWLTELLSKRITDYGLDVYRNDFNMDPLDSWRRNDAPDRQGMTEIRYIEGLYQMWDELLARHPGLLIDNCASGGRRIDLEMCSRSVPLWRSDTGCTSGHFDWNHVQTMGLLNYVPLFTSTSWSPNAYEARSAMTMGAVCEWGYLDPGFSADLSQATIAEIKACQAYWYGDYYPLTAATGASDQAVAWQLHRPDTGSGLVVAFRHLGCNLRSMMVRLHALRPHSAYTVEVLDDDRSVVRSRSTGQQLESGLVLNLPGAASSVIVRYALADK